MLLSVNTYSDRRSFLTSDRRLRRLEFDLDLRFGVLDLDLRFGVRDLERLLGVRDLDLLLLLGGLRDDDDPDDEDEEPLRPRPVRRRRGGDGDLKYLNIGFSAIKPEVRILVAILFIRKSMIPHRMRGKPCLYDDLRFWP